MRTVRAHLTYANVMATLAVFIALGGTGYAVSKIGSGQIKNNSVRSKDVRNETLRSRDVRNGGVVGKDIQDSSLTGADILESALETVPSAQQAANAATLGGVTAGELKVRCPEGTALSAAGCIELQPRAAAVYGSALASCALAGRRLPTHGELRGAFANRPAGLADLSSAGELTSSVFGEPLQVLVMTTDTGDTDAVGPSAGNERPYRCVASPSD